MVLWLHSSKDFYEDATFFQNASRKKPHLESLVVDQSPCASVSKLIGHQVRILQSELLVVDNIPKCGAVLWSISGPLGLGVEPSPNGVGETTVDREIAAAQHGQRK